MPNNKKSKNNKAKNAKREAKRVADYDNKITKQQYCFAQKMKISKKSSSRGVVRTPINIDAHHLQIAHYAEVDILPHWKKVNLIPS